MISNLLDAYKDDPTLQNTLNIEELLQEEQYGYIQNRSLQSFLVETKEILENHCHEKEKTNKILGKLHEYRFVDDLCDLHKGKHIRWIRINSSPELTNGGLVMDIKFTNVGTQILVKSKFNRFIQIKWDDCLVFQKFTEDELMILGLSDAVLPSTIS